MPSVSAYLISLFHVKIYELPMNSVALRNEIRKFPKALREDKNFAESSDKRLKREADASRFGKKDHVSL